jgi:hypothetical protein
MRKNFLFQVFFQICKPVTKYIEIENDPEKANPFRDHIDLFSSSHEKQK